MWIQICLLFVKKMCGLISPDKKYPYKKYPGGDVAGLQAELERLASLASPDNKVVRNMLQKIRFCQTFLPKTKKNSHVIYVRPLMWFFKLISQFSM